jgi:hypothetical protein
VRRVEFEGVAVLVGADADALAVAAAALRKGEPCRVAVFVQASGRTEDSPALDAFCSEQFGTRR